MTVPTLADAAWLTRKQLPTVERDRRVPLGELGGALFTAERAMDRASGLLDRVDRQRLEASLENQRAMAVLSERAEAEVALLTARIAAVERANADRLNLTDIAGEAIRLLGDPDEITVYQLNMLQSRVVEATDALDNAVTHAAAVLDPLSFKLIRTRHRGVYRSGGLYLVPFVDTLGADRCRDFDSLSEARKFRDALRIVMDAKPGYDPVLPPVDTGGGG